MPHLTTGLLGAAGLCWTIGQAVLPDMSLKSAERYDLVAADRGAESLSAGLLVLAGACLVLGVLTATRRMASWIGPGSRALSIGAALTALGGLWLVGGRAAFNLTFYRITDPEVPRDVGVRLVDGSGGVGFVLLLLMLPALLVGPAVWASGLRRAGSSTWWPLVFWVVGLGTFLATEFTVKAGEIAGIGVAAVALILIGRAVEALPPSLEDGPREDRSTITTAS